MKNIKWDIVDTVIKKKKMIHQNDALPVTFNTTGAHSTFYLFRGYMKNAINVPSWPNKLNNHWGVVVTTSEHTHEENKTGN